METQDKLTEITLRETVLSLVQVTVMKFLGYLCLQLGKTVLTKTVNLLFTSVDSPQNILNSVNMDRDMAPVKYVRPVLHGDTQLSDQRDIGNDMRFLERGSQLVPSKISRDIALEIEDFDIPWEDLVLKERIGAGNPCLLSFVSSFLVSCYDCLSTC